MGRVATLRMACVATSQNYLVWFLESRATCCRHGSVDDNCVSYLRKYLFRHVGFVFPLMVYTVLVFVVDASDEEDVVCIFSLS